MASFNISYSITEPLEGGHANIKGDNGKETYCGISRRYYPNWKGWAFIDRMKPIKWNTTFKSLNPLVRAFYLKEYWDKLQLSYLHQSLANQLFDFAVNSGKGRAVKELQNALNSFGERLVVDGGLGKMTLAAIFRHDGDKLAKNLHARRTLFLKKVAEDQPTFKNGWSNRLNVMKSHLTSALPIVLAVTGLTLLF